jgi:exodeoxyribonuclease V alpha subunit
MVVVDETSMVSLSLMARLLEGLSRDTRLVLVGDPFQLASIEAGTVLGDLVGPNEAGSGVGASGVGAQLELPGIGRASEAQPLVGHVTVFSRMHRFHSDSAIAELARLIQQGDPDGVIDLLRAANANTGGGDLRWVLDTDSPALDSVLEQLVEVGVEVATCALAGDGEGALSAAGRLKLLAATRHGPFGLYEWSERIEVAVGERVPTMKRGQRWYVGRPIIVSENDPVNRVANGDVGVVVARDRGMDVALRSEEGLRWVAPSRLDRVESYWAMTIHKSQGSEYPHAVVSLPRAGSPILTRELLYTAITRAREQLTIVGSEPSLREAVDRPVARASGLRERLWSS